MRIGLCQFNPIVGDVRGNAGRMSSFIDEARQEGVELLVFPELAICGYPPRDLLLQENFVSTCAREAKRLGEGHSKGLSLIFGCPLPVKRGIANSLLVYRDGEYVDYYDKRLLPTYDVFDEDRYFMPGDRAVVFELQGVKIGLSICEDLWKGEDAGFSSRYRDRPDPVAELAAAGARLIVSPSASPFVLGKGLRHRDLLVTHARRHGVWVAGVNQVGGNDDLVFDGHATLHAPDGALAAAGPGFDEVLVTADFDPTATTPAEPVADPRVRACAEELVFRAIELGVRDYVRKTGFETALLGLSGGIDSAVTAAIAAAALGKHNVLGIAMPGKYSSEHSVSDAVDCAERLGIRLATIPIQQPFDGFRNAIDPAFKKLGAAKLGEKLPDITEENLQSRVRGTTLMTLSNRLGSILLTTGNKSELAVGYCTLYGDMNGGVAVLSDVTKQMVYRLARWMNDRYKACGFDAPPIPENTITKPPSAELAPDQTDQDSLPTYDVLDEIVERYVEDKQSPARIVEETGFDEPTVNRICRLIDLNEYKRKQTAVGIKITSVAFGSGRRVPIAQGWRPWAGP